MNKNRIPLYVNVVNKHKKLDILLEVIFSIPTILLAPLYYLCYGIVCLLDKIGEKLYKTKNNILRLVLKKELLQYQKRGDSNDNTSK